jgi:trypsin
MPASHTRFAVRISVATTLIVALSSAVAQRSIASTPAEAGASVIQGTTASIAEFPWLADITYRGAREGFDCTGTVVAPRLVLTAAHCAISEAGRVQRGANYRVITGVADLKQKGAGQVSSVAEVVAFPGFRTPTLIGDAALLVLSAPVSAPAIPLAGSSDGALYAGGTQLNIAGWGLTNGGATRTPTVLREGQTVIQSAGYCERAAKKIVPTFNGRHQLCAVSKPRYEVSSCHGDSGGPGIAHRPDGSSVQVGVISLGAAECDPRSPEIQTRVDTISSWVNEWIVATESGGPRPVIAQPELTRLPKMTFETAKYIDYEIMAASFRNRFLHGSLKEIDCRRIEREKVKCLVFWYYARHVYSGSITTFFALPREGSLWNYHFRIRRYDAVCWVYSRHSRSCPRRVFHA